MKPKPPPPPDLPPAVPPPYRLIATETRNELEAQVNEAINAGLKVEANSATFGNVNGLTIISQLTSRDPKWNFRVRSRLSTQKVINNGGIW